MIATGTRDLKNHLGRYLHHVRKGEEVLITVHGKAVARIVKEPAKNVPLRDRLAPLVANGLIELPQKDLSKEVGAPAEIEGKPLSKIIIEERR